MSVISRPTIALVGHGVHEAGGMERVCTELIRRAGDRYRFVVVSSELATELRGRVEWRRVPTPRRPFPLRFLTFFVLAGLRLAWRRADLVHTTGALVPNRADVASVHYCHAGFRRSAGTLPPPRRPLLRRLNTGVDRALSLAAERWSYRAGWLRSFAAVSADVATELRQLYPGVDVVVTPNGVDQTVFRPDPAERASLREHAGVRDGDVVVLFVGGDWDRKGLGLAIAGLREGIRRGGRHLRLWVVGDGDRQRFEQYAATHGVAGRVSFFGSRRDAPRFYQAADLFVIPSCYEAFSLATLEAAASGLPIVATHVNGIGEVVGDGEGGILVERTPESVGAALVRLADDAALRARLAESARSRAAGYTWERSAEAVLAQYDRLLGAGTR